MAKKDENALKCSFCGKGHNEVKSLSPDHGVHAMNASSSAMVIADTSLRR
jgi:hypothetical protein